MGLPDPLSERRNSGKPVDRSQSCKLEKKQPKVSNSFVRFFACHWFTFNISILLYKFVKFGVYKRFWHYNFPFSRSLWVWKVRIEWQFCTRDEVEGVNLSQYSQFFERDDSVKMEIYSGKTLSPANLSNEYNRMLFLIFRFPENRHPECGFRG